MKSLPLAALIAVCAAWAAPVRAVEAPASPGQDLKQTWEDYRIKTRQELDVLDDKLGKLESDVKTAEGESRAQFQAETKHMRAQKEAADRMLEKFAAASEEARAELRVKLDRSLRDLRRSIRKTESRLKDRT
jgi:hypothetical protein